MQGGAKTVILGATIGALTGIAAVVAIVISSDDPPDPAETVLPFVAAWNAGDVARMRPLVVDPAALARFDPIEVASELGSTTTAVAVAAIGEVDDGDGVTVPFRITLTVGERGEIEWSGALRLVNVDDEGWRVGWSEQAMHPSIPDGGTMQRTMTWPARAPILGASDQVLVGPVGTTRVGIEPRRFDRAQSLPVLAQRLGLEPSAIEAALDAPGVQPDHFVEITEVHPEEVDAVLDSIRPIPGVVVAPGAERGGPTPGFARNTIGRYGEATAEDLEELGELYREGDRVGLDGLEASYERHLAGEPAMDFRIVDTDGEMVEVVGSFDAVEPEPLRTTLDSSIQLAAEEALASAAGPAALVAVDAASGEVRAAVSRPLGAFNRAIAGMYPPGSTFKVVTGYALLTNGLEPASPVECPAEVRVGGRRFRNFEGEAAGTLPFSQAFAHSCNTAFIGATQELPDGALAAAADAFGFGVDYSVGLTTLGGSFPELASEVEHAAAAIGQARVTASPLHMATVAAAALDGTWRAPFLVRDGAELPTRPLDPVAHSRLAELMRLVVSEGTGTAARVPGLDLLGKTGTAEFGSGSPPPTHAWFIAAGRGLGVAVVLDGGGVGGRDAAPIAARFFRALG